MKTEFSGCRLIVIACKRPVPGKVKTRLARSIGSEAAAKLYHAFLEDTVATASAVPNASLALSYAAGSEPDEDRAFLRRLAPGAEHWMQAEGDLGQRISAIFDRAHAQGFSETLLVGSDAPHLTAATYGAALERLRSEPRVIGPTEDGGFWGVGLRSPGPQLFQGVEWSTERTLSGVLQNALEGGVPVGLLPSSFDVDDEPSLERLSLWLSEQEEELCPRTRALLG